MLIKKLNHYLFCLLLPIVLLNSNIIEGATLHAILVADTLEGDLSLMSECSLDMMNRQVKRIASYCDLSLDVACFEGFHALFPENIKEYMENTDIKPDDIVFLCFFMHGTRGPNKSSQWPELNFPFESSDFGSFIDIMKNKHPKLLLAWADSCNSISEIPENYYEDDKQEELPEGYTFEMIVDQIAKKGPSLRYTCPPDEEYKNTIENNILDNYKSLFLMKCGSIVMSSSSPGQSALREVYGGIFTATFLETLRKTMNPMYKKELSWLSIIEETITVTEKLAKEKNHIQVAQYEIDLY
jgi:hypothetical protein